MKQALNLLLVPTSCAKKWMLYCSGDEKLIILQLQYLANYVMYWKGQMLKWA